MSVQAADPLAQATALLTAGDIGGAERIAQARLAQGADGGMLHLLALVRIRQERPQEGLDLMLQALALMPGQPQILCNLGKLLAFLQRDDEAAKALEQAVRAEPRFADAWQTLGEVQQCRGEAGKAEICFRKVLALAPAHSGARIALGALLNETERSDQAEDLLAEGMEQAQAVPLKAEFAHALACAQYGQGKKDTALKNFELAQSLDPARGSTVDVQRAHLLCELSRFEEAEAVLKELVQREPLNDSAHFAYNNLLYSLRREDEFLASYDRAPATTGLQLSKATLLAIARMDEGAGEIYRAILAREPDNHEAVSGLADVLSKLGRHGEAVSCLEQALVRAPDNAQLLAGIAGAALQGGDPQKAAAMAQKVIARAPQDQLVLALLGSAWRVMGDERDEILNGYDDLIQIFDLEPPRGFSDMATFNAELNAWLTGQHSSKQEPITQSLRAGTQTWGNIFGAGHDLVERVRVRIAEALDRYIAGIKPQSAHPFRGRTGNGFRFRGSWSSRLGNGGHHINHVHPSGWISSCYYVGVPDAVKDANTKEGWIKFGEPGFDIGLAPRRAIQPVPGRLVLFPSYMWHGTIPFHGEARTTIAFDATPRG